MAEVKLPIGDPSQAVLKARNQLEVQSNKAPDEKELAEREKAAQAYFGEDEAHFVRFHDDCVKMSVDSMRRIRTDQQELWDIYNEEEPPHYQLKESWQSRVTVPKPFASVQLFLALVRKAFTPEFLSIKNELKEDDATFILKCMELLLSKSFSNFPMRFTDAAGMGAAVGQSMEMIPQWIPGKGLQYVLIPPWNIQRDPDSLSREPWSGMYWIHQEWLDYHELKEMERVGQLANIPDCGPGGTWGSEKDNPDLSLTEIKRRQEMTWQQSSTRTKVLTSEYWGQILDKRGKLLLPSGWFTVVGDRVIRLPRKSPYQSLRWPGVGFSPLPHLLRFDGRSLLKGIKSLWYMMCNLFSLYVDNYNWIVNPSSEIDISNLVDTDDIDDFPGKPWLVKATQQGQQVVRMIDRKSATGDTLASLNFTDQRFQEGVMINYAAQGLPGYRQAVTATENANNLEQSLTVMGLMGENLEDGALNAIIAGWETVALNMTHRELANLMGQEVADRYAAGTPTGLKLPHLTTGSFSVSGAAALMRNSEVIQGISNLILPLLKEGNIFIPYIKPYALLKSLILRLNLEDEKIIVDAEDAKRIDAAQQKQQEAGIEHQGTKEEADAQAAQALAERHGAQTAEYATEAEKNKAQGGLFDAQAAAAGAGGAPPAEAAAPPAEPAAAPAGATTPPEMIQ